MTNTGKISIFWFRRDLRLEDNTALYYALTSGMPVVPIFIYDTEILDDLDDSFDRRVDFIHRSLTLLAKHIGEHGGALRTFHGKPVEIFKQLVQTLAVGAVFTNRDYEPYAKQRDDQIVEYLTTQRVSFFSYKDQLIFEKDEVLKPSNEPYTVYTPYSKRWKKLFAESTRMFFPSENFLANFLQTEPIPTLSLAEIGFQPTDLEIPPAEINESTIRDYEKNRDYPSMSGTSRLSVHLRFGTVSIRHVVAKAVKISEKWLNELIWREFYAMILWHFPQVVDQAFKPQYDKIEWRNSEAEFEAWCEGRTGYPIVDAGMRELNQTGFMHNRVRMVTASFLIKHLLVDWRWGEAYFAKKLLDFDLSSNNGSWQWAASSGCDAAPYFRIFNPYLQTEKFDPERDYISRWVPEWNTHSYPLPIVKHDVARKRALAAYEHAVKGVAKL